MYTNGMRQSGVGVALACGGVGVGGVTVPPDPIFWNGGWFSSEPAVGPQL